MFVQTGMKRRVMTTEVLDVASAASAVSTKKKIFLDAVEHTASLDLSEKD